jgi:superfamily II DNA/RNA helicase
MRKLLAHGYLAGAIHGNVAQTKREKVLNGFKDGSIRVLVATDVAARGLDIDAVDCVINFDAPMDPDTYVHRIGRTGRAGMLGTAISFFTPEERSVIKQIESKTGKPIDPLDLVIVHRPEPEVKRVAPVHNVPNKAGTANRPAGRHNGRPSRGGAHQGRPPSGARGERMSPRGY